jgi:adenylate cyclase
VASPKQSQSSRPASRPGGSTAGRSGWITDRRPAAATGLIVVGALAAAWALALTAAAIRGNWNDRLNDLFFQLRYLARGPETVLPTINSIDFTDAEIRALGMKSGDRRAFARLVDVLSRAGASSIVFDIIFPDPGQADGDAAFASAAAAAGSVYLPAILVPQAVGKIVGRAAAGDDPLAPWIWHPRIVRRGDPIDADRATLSFPALTAASRAVAAINLQPDADGVYRRIPLLLRAGDGYLPTLALRVACDELNVDPALIEVAFGRALRLPHARMRDGTVRDLAIPIDRSGNMIIDFPGPWGTGFTHYQPSKLLAAETDPDVADSVAMELDGSILIVSDISTASNDYGSNPFERVFPRSGIHAAALNSILSDRFLRAPSWVLVLLLNLAFGAALWLVAWRMRPLAGSLLMIAAWAALTAAEGTLFIFRGIMASLAAPTLALALALVAVNGYRFFLSEKEKLEFRLRMERYFAPRLMAKIMGSPGTFLAADKKVITILFSDIAGFTSWCTTQSPDAIHRTLNEYFEAMTEIVFRNEGTVDKFIGDGLMAFFGDPLPQIDHAARAVRTAIEMQQAVRVLRERWQAEGRMPIHIRVGINSGEVVVGDMGSQRIRTYTAIGSHVNLCSRLESKAPVDGVLVSTPVHEAVKAAVATRFAGRITAKGIADEFDTWEVLVP